MEQIVVDTNIIIDFLRLGKGYFEELVHLQEAGQVELIISSVTVFELFSGQSSKKTEEVLTEMITKIKVVPFDGAVAKLAGELNRDGNFFSGLADLIVGATALYSEAKLATNNQKHFCGLPGLRFFKY